MNKQSKCKQILKGGVVFICVLALTWFILLRNENIAELLNIIRRVKIPYIFIALACMGLFVLGEAWNIKRCLGIFGYHKNIFQTIKYALVGFFFSSITPSATGGQPMQIYYMQKDKVSISHSSLALLIELSSFQVVSIMFACIGLIGQYNRMTQSIGGLRYLILLGVFMNFMILVIVLIFIFSKRLSTVLVNGVVVLIRLCRYKKVEQLEEKLYSHLQEYQESATHLKNKKGIVLQILLTTVLQVAALHSIPYWIYLSFGLEQYSLWTILALQSVLYVSVSAFPVPGAMGVSESGFVLLYQSLFPAHLLSGAMLLSRGVSFYIAIAISGLIIFGYSLVKSRNYSLKKL
ncbi:lysylphosphatidylglycerol synthase transmembrane domain-containing protein [Niameybacter massiliensis]|uniref:lysylphosphatidylglycerol synthase transmembrane domain-containing protein n=1 Tax=Niameybacter massiliensis TaxID=1658108 RepID=UPI0006B496CD|nr:lysylphosphatidylglycerol synthase transmembrane domain-containing protein [Niameybacter massiliensis]